MTCAGEYKAETGLKASTKGYKITGMKLSSDQRALVKAVQRGDLSAVKSLLKDKNVDPNVKARSLVSPLNEAIKTGNIHIVKALVLAGAKVNQPTADKKRPLDHAHDVGRKGIYNYLKGKGALHSAPYRKKVGGPTYPSSTQGVFNQSSAPVFVPRPPPPLRHDFSQAEHGQESEGAAPETETVENDYVPVEDIFKPEKWVGKTKEMQKRWHDLEKWERDDFDFETALAEAQRLTLNQGKKNKIKIERTKASRARIR